MGWAVIAEGSIEMDFDRFPRLEGKFKQLLRKDAAIYDVQKSEGEILFKMVGNKSLDYSALKEIHELMKKYECNGAVHATEYVEYFAGGFHREFPE